MLGMQGSKAAGSELRVAPPCAFSSRLAHLWRPYLARSLPFLAAAHDSHQAVANSVQRRANLLAFLLGETQWASVTVAAAVAAAVAVAASVAVMVAAVSEIMAALS